MIKLTPRHVRSRPTIGLYGETPTLAWSQQALASTRQAASAGGGFLLGKVEEKPDGVAVTVQRLQPFPNLRPGVAMSVPEWRAFGEEVRALASSKLVGFYFIQPTDGDESAELAATECRIFEKFGDLGLRVSVVFDLADDEAATASATAAAARAAAPASAGSVFGSSRWFGFGLFAITVALAFR